MEGNRKERLLKCYDSMEYVLLRHHVTHTRSNTLLFCDLAFLLLQNLGESDENESLCGAGDRATERRQGSPSTEKREI